MHRFPNGPVSLGDTFRWDVLRLWAEIQNGLALAGKKFGKQIVSVGADTWGVDFVLLNKQDEILGQPYHYRDARTRGLMEQAFKKVPRAEIFAQSGLQFMEFNSLYQLLAWQEHSPEMLDAADTLLFMPDFLHWACAARNGPNSPSPRPRNSCIRSSATGRCRCSKNLVCPRIFCRRLFRPARTGQLRKSLAERTGLAGVKVVAPPSHDTASAVAGVPTANTGKANWAYISSGTWSLMGVEVQQGRVVAARVGIEHDQRRRH